VLTRSFFGTQKILAPYTHTICRIIRIWGIEVLASSYLLCSSVLIIRLMPLIHQL